MLDYLTRQLHKVTVLTNTDRVILGIPLADGAILKAVSARIHCFSTELPAISAAMYNVAQFVVPVPDPDASITYDGIWDLTVPKDLSVTTAIDLDTAQTQAAPELEPGEWNLQAVYDVPSIGVHKLPRRGRLMTMADSGAGGFATGGATHWLPRDRFTMNSTPNIRVQVPSIYMMAFSSPVLDGTTVTITAAPTESEWILLQHLRETAARALMSLSGLTEAGATTPWVDSANFLAKILEPKAFEETAGEFVTLSWEVVCQSEVRVSTPGAIDIGMLDSQA